MVLTAKALDLYWSGEFLGANVFIGLSVPRALSVRDVKSMARDRIVMMGFSQGACLTSEFAIRNASRFGGFVAFSGGAIGPPGTTWNEDGRFEGTPMFFGCSDVDAHIPEVRVHETSAICTRMGAKVTTRIYPGMGHLVNDDEIAHAQALLDSVAAGS